MVGTGADADETERSIDAQCLAEEARGTKDSWNGILGGIAAGGILGIKGKRRNHGFYDDGVQCTLYCT